MMRLRLVPKPRPQRAFRVVPLTADLFSLALAGASDPFVTEQGSQPGVLANVLRPNLSFAILDGGSLVCALGIFPVVFGRAQGWMIKTPLATRAGLAYTVRQTRAHFDRWITQPAFCRIEMHIRDGQPWRDSFAARLGMNEGPYLMRKWDNLGRDYWLYARVAP